MPVLTTANNRTAVVAASEIQEGHLPIGTDVDESQWRGITGGGRQDLPPLDQSLQARIGRFNYTRNLIGHRLLELMRDYVIGGDVGFRIMAKEAAVQEVIDAHWEDPANDWIRRLPQDVLDISQDGELVVPVEVSEGRVFCGKVDPLVINKVERDPFFMTKAKVLFLKAGDIGDDIPKTVIALDRDPSSKTFRKRVGDIFFWAINRPSGGTRGVSDLFPLADVIDQVDRFMFARARNAELRNYHMWDVTLTGASENDITKFLDAQRQDPPKAGSIRAHNELVKWTSVRPDTQAEDAAREAELLLSYVLFGFGIPPTVSGIISTGRTALSEQIDVLYKTFSSRAREIRNIVTDIINFVIDQAVIGDLLSDDVNKDFKVVLPRIALRDIQRTGGALSRVGEFFSNMKRLGIYDETEIRGMLDIFLAALGFDVPDMSSVLKGEEKPKPDEEEEEEEEEETSLAASRR